MDRHVALLATLAGLWGALAALIGVSLLLLAGAAAAVITGPEGEAVTIAAGLTAAMFATIGGSCLLGGLAHMWVGRRLRRHDPIGRIVMLGLAVVNLLIFPFGTALGLYALWMLLSNEGRHLFVPAGHVT